MVIDFIYHHEKHKVILLVTEPMDDLRSSPPGMLSPLPTSCDVVARSIQSPDEFWAEQAELIDWHRSFDSVCDRSRLPFVRWFPGGKTNLCYNAVDRHLSGRGDQPAIRFISTETGEERSLTYRELHAGVVRMANTIRSLGVGEGDRVIIYMPMIPESAIAMLACARMGAVHSVVFAGFAAESLARRIKDAGAKLLITCDAGLRNGKLIRLKKTADEALDLAESAARLLLISRGLDLDAPMNASRDLVYPLGTESIGASDAGCVWRQSSSPSYILYTSGTTAKPKGIQRDVGGYAVALAASMGKIYGCKRGETFFCTADIGWVVGHSYSVYGPLIHGMTTIFFEGLPIHHNAAAWWEIVASSRASVMFSSPTAIRVLKKHPSDAFDRLDLTSLRSLFLAGEPLDEPTAEWIQAALPGTRIVDNYWQTETGWPVLSELAGGKPSRHGSPGCPVYGYDAFVADEESGEPVPCGQRGVLAIRAPLPPGCMTTIWQNDEQFQNLYFGQFPGKVLYSTFDYAVEDEEGNIFILGRTDDVINVAGHRIGTREIEESLCSHPAVAEAAAVGVADEVKWQVIKCFVVLKEPDRYDDSCARQAVLKEIEETVVGRLGAIARPAFVGLVKQLPKTRSGKIVRRAILAIAEGRDPGDLSTLEDPMALDHIREAQDGNASR